MTGRTIKPGFDPDSLTHLMDVLAGVYSDPTEAVAREYITNALDAQRDAGYDGPVQVTLPSMWSPNYVVKDRGTGMDLTTMEDVYVNYGASTKRSNAAANGMLGIGAKCAYAYSNSWVITSVKDGLRNTLSFGRDDKGDPTAVFLEENVATDEPNGTTVTVPVKDTSSMRRAVEKVCKVMPEGAVLVDGKDLSERSKWTLVAQNVADDDGNIIILNMWTLPSQYWYAQSEARIIMGNVAYTPMSDITIADFRDQTVYAEVAMGAVAFAPSREKLKESALTSRTEAFVKKAYKDNLAKALIKDVLDKPTHTEALTAYHKVYRTLRALGHSEVKYKGKEIPKPEDYYVDEETLVARSYFPFRSRDTTDHSSHITYESLLMSGVVLVKNAPDRSLTPTMKRKIKQYNDREQVLPRQQHGSNYYSMFLLFVEGKMPKKNVWTKDLQVIDWADIEKEVLPKQPRGSRASGGGVKMKGKYHVVENKSFNLREIEDDETNLYYINARGMRRNYAISRMLGLTTPMADHGVCSAIEKVRDELGDDAVVVDVYANRLDKFKREFPHAKELTEDDVTDKMKSAVKKSITDDAVEGWAIYSELGYLYGRESVYDYIPDADTDKAWLLSGPSRSDDHDTINHVRRVMPYDVDVTKRLTAAQDKVRKRKEEIHARYPLMGLARYADSKMGSHMKRYFEADWNIYNNNNSQED